MSGYAVVEAEYWNYVRVGIYSTYVSRAVDYVCVHTYIDVCIKIHINDRFF